jgi:glycosyltransferase involved in cell wall biosynthesis
MVTTEARAVRVMILHYAAPPIVGGVESTIYHHARLLTAAGLRVEITAGRGKPVLPDMGLQILPEADSRHPEVLAVKAELDRGQVTERFYALRNALVHKLDAMLQGVDVLIGHNVFTLHKNLPLTAALYEWIVGKGPRNLGVLAWHHDLAWRDPQYAGEVHAGYPWDLLRMPWPGVRHVTVSEARREHLAAMYGLPAEQIAVVPPGVDPAERMLWTSTTRRIVEAFRLDSAEVILLLPARITRRKNIELAIRAVAALRRQTGLDARLLVSGPPGAHNPANIAYLERLQRLREEEDVLDAVHFVYTLGQEGNPLVPDDATMANLFLLADALLFPSLEEGFGIPVLEAGLVRLPVFCSDIAPFQATGQDDVFYFSPQARPEDVAGLIARHLLTDRTFRLRRRVRREYAWDRIVHDIVIPLIQAAVANR